MNTIEYEKRLVEAYRKNFGEHKVIHNEKLRGTFNKFSYSVREIRIGRRVIAIKFKDGKIWNIDPVSCAISKLRTNIFRDDYIESRKGLRLNERGRYVLNIYAEDSATKQSLLSYARLIGYINDLVLNDFNTREDYELLDGAHLDGSGSGRKGREINDIFTNIELADRNSNLEHNLVWSENDSIDVWIKSSADDDYIKWYRQVGTIESVSMFDGKVIAQKHINEEFDSIYVLYRQCKLDPYMPVGVVVDDGWNLNDRIVELLDKNNCKID